MRKQGKSAFGRDLREYALGVGVELHQSSKNIAGPHVVNAAPPSVGHPELRSEHAQPGARVPPDMLVVVSTDGKTFHAAGVPVHPRQSTHSDNCGPGSATRGVCACIPEDEAVLECLTSPLARLILKRALTLGTTGVSYYK
jgi:hypothetical protein